MEYFSIEQIGRKYGLTIHQVRRKLQGKATPKNTKVGAKNRVFYSEKLVLEVFGAQNETQNETRETPRNETPQTPEIQRNEAKSKTRNETPQTPQNDSTDQLLTDASGKGKIFTPENVKRYASKVFYLKKMVANLERENDHLRSQNQNLTTLLAMEKQATLQSPKNDLQPHETKETALSIGLLFLFVCGAILMLFSAFWLFS